MPPDAAEQIATLSKLIEEQHRKTTRKLKELDKRLAYMSDQLSGIETILHGMER